MTQIKIKLENQIHWSKNLGHNIQIWNWEQESRIVCFVDILECVGFAGIPAIGGEGDKLNLNIGFENVVATLSKYLITKLMKLRK